jgi:hypothetical protein
LRRRSDIENLLAELRPIDSHNAWIGIWGAGHQPENRHFVVHNDLPFGGKNGLAIECRIKNPNGSLWSVGYEYLVTHKQIGMHLGIYAPTIEDLKPLEEIVSSIDLLIEQLPDSEGA